MTRHNNTRPKSRTPREKKKLTNQNKKIKEENTYDRMINYLILIKFIIIIDPENKFIQGIRRH